MGCQKLISGRRVLGRLTYWSFLNKFNWSPDYDRITECSCPALNEPPILCFCSVGCEVRPISSDWALGGNHQREIRILENWPDGGSYLFFRYIFKSDLTAKLQPSSYVRCIEKTQFLLTLSS